jgi:hypothetical protein
VSGRPARRRRHHPRPERHRRPVKVLAAALASVASLVTVLEFAGLGPSGIAARPGGAPTMPPTPPASTVAPGCVTRLVPAVGGMPQAQAGAVLRTAGFQVRVQYASAVDGTRVGRVLAQAPAAGSPLSRGGVVAIVVGSAEAS